MLGWKRGKGKKTYILRRPLFPRQHDPIDYFDPHQPAAPALLLDLPQRHIPDFGVARQIVHVVVVVDADGACQGPQLRLHGHDDGDGFGAVLRRDDADVTHDGAGAVDGLEFLERDVLAVERLDHVLLAVNDLEQAAAAAAASNVGVGEFPNVARLEPAVVESFFVLLRQVQVAFRDGGAADPDLALRVGLMAGEVVQIGAVDEFDLDAAGGLAESGGGPGGGVADGAHTGMACRQ